MKTFRYKRYIAFLFLVGIFSACKDEFLEMPPQDSIVDANFYKTSEQVLAGSAPLYNIVWFAYNDKASHGLGDARGGVLTSGSYQVTNVQMNTTGLTGENVSSWRSFYNIVGQCNTLINNVTKFAGKDVPENIKQHAIAEGRFMRGLAYSYLVQNWGAVPIIVDNTKVLGDTSITRNTVESVWEFIIKDMRFAAEHLPESPVLKGRLTKYAAEGMLSKMYLTRAGVRNQGGIRNQSDLDSAALLAKDVIDNTPDLLPVYEDLFLTKNNNNQESLFALQWVYNGDWGAQNSVQAFLAFGSSITGFADGWGGDIGASKYMLDKYEAGDKRRKATFMFPGDHYPYIHQQVDDPANPGKTLIQELVVPLNNNTDGAYNTRAWVKKYVVGRPQDNDGKVLQQRTEINTYMLRTAEVYLIYAEALLGNNSELSSGEGLEYFNLVRKRAGVSEKASITWDDIFNERHLELAMEGQLWYDFIRLHYYNPEKAYNILSSQERGFYRIVPNTLPNPTSWTITLQDSRKYNVSGSNFLLPIPADELAKAPNLRKEPVPFDFSKIK
jgi:starch-binding outer membrane protein, SusD/RagB family